MDSVSVIIDDKSNSLEEQIELFEKQFFSLKENGEYRFETVKNSENLAKLLRYLRGKDEKESELAKDLEIQVLDPRFDPELGIPNIYVIVKKILKRVWYN